MTSVLQKLRNSFVSDTWRPGPLYRYGMLVVCVALLAHYFWWLSLLSASYPHERYSGFVVPFLLLLNHLAYAFQWSRRTTITLRIVAWVWTAFACFYIFSHLHAA